MRQEKYNEFKVTVDANKEIVSKMATERGSVTIYPHEAERLNRSTWQTKFFYELADSQKQAKKEKQGADDDVSDEKSILWSEIESMISGGVLEEKDRPHHATGIEKLRLFIKDNQPK